MHVVSYANAMPIYLNLRIAPATGSRQNRPISLCAAHEDRTAMSFSLALDRIAIGSKRFARNPLSSAAATSGDAGRPNTSTMHFDCIQCVQAISLAAIYAFFSRSLSLLVPALVYLFFSRAFVLFEEFCKNFKFTRIFVYFSVISVATRSPLVVQHHSTVPNDSSRIFSLRSHAHSKLYGLNCLWGAATVYVQVVHQTEYC